MQPIISFLVEALVINDGLMEETNEKSVTCYNEMQVVKCCCKDLSS